MTPDETAEIAAYIRKNRTSDAPFDLVIGDYLSTLERGELTERIEALELAGATWWVDKIGALVASEAEARIRQGPPRR